MITRIIRFSIANRIFVLLAALVLAAWGTWAVKNTPVDALPDLSDVQVIVRTNYPGQAPQIVENQVTYPLTTTMLSVPGVKTVRGYSFFGDSFVYVIFDEHTDLYWARSRVLEYLNQIQGRIPANAKSSLGPDATGVGWVYEYALIAKNKTLAELRKKYPNYNYKEATLNPTNPRDRASDWEADLVQNFRNRPDSKEITGQRDTPTGRSLYVAHPIRIETAACLPCHSTPGVAPPSMIKVYGNANGFGWKLNEVVGAQVVSVPMSVPLENANQAFRTFMVSLAGVFGAVFVVLNLMLSSLIIGPVSRMSAAADKISTGDFDQPEFPEEGKDEVAVLANAFNRMRRSLEKAMQMIDG